jgi:hypothetical protein
MIVIDVDLDVMFNRIADGIATEEKMRGFGESLHTSFDTRRAYRDFMMLHSALHGENFSAFVPEVPHFSIETELALELNQ